MKFIFAIVFFLVLLSLAGCADRKQELVDACMSGAIIGIKTMGRHGAELPGDRNSEEMTNEIISQCGQLQ